MYRTYELTEEEKKKPILSAWDGDTTIYTVFENEEEKQEEQKRLDKIQKEYEEKMKAYIESLK